MTNPIPVAVLAVGSIVFGAAPALAQGGANAPGDEKASCSQAFEQAQRLRNETKYLAAKEQALQCANPKCGDALFQECTKIYEELGEAIPSVVFGARDAAKGNEITNVVVTIDGVQATSQLDGKPVLIDPGSHVFTFTSADFPPVERRAVVRAGEKYRQISVVLGEGAADAPPPGVDHAPTTPPLVATEPRARTVPVASYVLGGVSVLALGGFVALRVMGSSDYDKLKDDCAPTCKDSEVDSTRRKYLLSYASLGLSAAALIGAVTVYLVQPTESAPQAAAFVGPTADGFAGGLRGTF